MELVLSLLSTLGGLIQTCYDLYYRNKLNKQNGKAAKNLAERLRDIQESISTATECDQRDELAKILKNITADIDRISDYLSVIARQLSKMRGLAAIIDAPSICTNLRDSLHIAILCQSRLESVQLFIMQIRRNDMFLRDWKILYDKFTQVVNQTNVDASISDAFEKLNRATQMLLPTRGASDVSELTADGPLDIDRAEVASMKTLEVVPPAVQALVLRSAQDRIQNATLKNIVADFLALWDGWHIHYNAVRIETRRNLQVKLGSGGFGTVLAGNLVRNTGRDEECLVAVKQIDIPDDEPTVLAEIMREALLQMSLHHHCIVRCFGVSLPPSAGSVLEMKEMLLDDYDDDDETSSASIITERMSCNLAEALRGKKKAMHITSLQDKMKIVTDVANALNFLHSYNIVHRDIKPENVLLNIRDGQMTGYAKLSDFGNSRRAHVEQTKTITTTISRVQGTPLFMPPETLKDMDKCRTTKAWDIWSYGVLLCYVFAYEQMPNFTSLLVQRYADDGSLPNRLHSWASHIALADMQLAAKQCLNINAEERMTHNPFEGSEKNELIHSRDVQDVRYPAESQGDVKIGRRCANSGSENLNKDGIEQDMIRAALLLEKDAALGCVDAIFKLGWCYENGNGVEKDEVRGARLYSQAAELGHVGAISNLGWCYSTGCGVEKDNGRAANLYKQASELGDSDAMYNLGLCYANGQGVEKDDVRATYLYKQAADRGHGSAVSNLGVCYENGHGVDRDIDRAAKLYEQAADLGNACATTNLGNAYRNGRGVEKSYVRAAQLYGRAVDLGNARAMSNLGWCYDKGHGVEKDDVRAVELYRKAANHGHAGGMSNLGVCYEYGRGVKKDAVRAAQLYKEAAILGNGTAIGNLGSCYTHGRGLQKLTRLADMFFEQARYLTQ